MMLKDGLLKGCAKGLLITLNVVCMIIALCTFAFAVIDAKILKQYGEYATNGTYTGDLVIIGACLLLVLVASMGCVGAAQENVKILYLYVLSLLLLVLMELLIGIFVSLKRYGLEFKVVDWIRDDFVKNLTGQELEDHRVLWDNLQSTYECCGLNGPEDYIAIGDNISLSCCSRAFRSRSEFTKKLLYKTCIETSSYYPVGCEDEILFTIREGANCLLGIGFISFWFEACGILLAMWMAGHISRDGRVIYEVGKY